MQKSVALAVAMAFVCSQVSIFAGPQSTSAAQQSSSNAPLRIVVVSGEDAVNIIQQKTAVAPLVEVRDRNNQPVAGAIVTFTIEGGRNASFAAGANAMTVTTNAAGQAAVSGLTPTASGAVQINVAAAFQGQTATAAITQTNFATAAQAAAAGSSTSSAGSSAGSGGGIGPGTITAISAAAAGVAGGLYAYKKYEEGDPPEVTGVMTFPAFGLAGITPIAVSSNESWHGDGATFRIEFGDGAQATGALDARTGFGPDDPNAHVYQAAGTYAIRYTLTDAWGRSSSSEGSVTIKDLNGRWNLGNTGSFYSLTQNGNTIAGTFTTANGQGSGTVAGSVSREVFGGTANNITLTVTPTGAGAASTFAGRTSSNVSADTITGTFSTGSSSSSQLLLRQ